MTEASHQAFVHGFRLVMLIGAGLALAGAASAALLVECQPARRVERAAIDPG